MNIALLIDCENAKASSIGGILKELAERGTTNIRRAYGDWSKQCGWDKHLHPFFIQPIQHFPYTKGKNAIDMCMTIDAMDLLYMETVDCFALVTSDSDFTPLVLKLLSKGKTVIGFGERKTPEAFRNACSEFIHTEKFKALPKRHPSAAGTPRRSRDELQADTALMCVLHEAIETMKGEDGYAALTQIGHYIAKQSSLSSKDHGYAKLSRLIRATERFRERTGDDGQPSFAVDR